MNTNLGPGQLLSVTAGLSAGGTASRAMGDASATGGQVPLISAGESGTEPMDARRGLPGGIAAVDVYRSLLRAGWACHKVGRDTVWEAPDGRLFTDDEVLKLYGWRGAE